MKPLFTQSPSSNTRMFIAVLASILLFVLDTRFDYFKPVREVMSSVAYPIQRIASTPTDITNWFNNVFSDRESLQEELAVLRANQLVQSARLQKMRSLEQENMRLKELLGSSFRLPERVQVAELLTVDLDPFSQQVIIDKGKNFNLYPGQPVLDAYGVMGQVSEVSMMSSRVVLLTDPNHSIPVQINRNGMRAVLTGRGLAEPLKLDFIPRHADIRIGDLLVTSGLGGRFPVGYPVGTVISVAMLPGEAFATVDVDPAAKLSTSRELMLVIPGEKVEITPADKNIEESDNGQ